jgi:hypothetical protein
MLACCTERVACSLLHRPVLHASWQHGERIVWFTHRQQDERAVEPQRVRCRPRANDCAATVRPSFEENKHTQCPIDRNRSCNFHFGKPICH